MSDGEGGDPFRPAKLPPGGPKKTREHIVPQWLQRGFSRIAASKRAQVAVYRSDGTSLWTSTANVGVRKSFFTSAYFDGDKTATELDGELAPVVEDLRNASGALRGDDARDACRLFAHLEVRQGSTERLLRTMYASVLPTVVASLREYTVPEMWLGRGTSSHREKRADTERRCARRLRRARGRQKTPPVDLPKMVEFVESAIESFRTLVATDVAASGAVVRDVIEDYGERLARGDVLEDAIVFNRSKEMFLRGEARTRVAGYAAFEWRIVHLAEDVVLPDSMVFHETTDSSAVQNFLHTPWNQAASYLPIASRTVLVGRSRASKRGSLRAGQIRYRAAQACSEFFVAADKDRAYDNLVPLIGSYRRFATALDWQAVAKECMVE